MEGEANSSRRTARGDFVANAKVKMQSAKCKMEGEANSSRLTARGDFVTNAKVKMQIAKWKGKLTADG